MSNWGDSKIEPRDIDRRILKQQWLKVIRSGNTMMSRSGRWEVRKEHSSGKAVPPAEPDEVVVYHRREEVARYSLTAIRGPNQTLDTNMESDKAEYTCEACNETFDSYDEAIYHAVVEEQRPVEPDQVITHV